MIRILKITALAVMLSAAACSGEKADGQSAAEAPVAETRDSIGEVISRVRATHRLYTTEYQVHKLVSYDDVRRLRGTVFGKKFDWRLPQGDRKVLIPMDAVIKGFIDFEGFSADNVRIDGDRVTVILPDPVVEVTSTKIDHSNIKEYVSLTRPSFSASELSLLEKQGRAAIVAAIPDMGIVDDARRSAYDMMVPMLTALGYRPEQITVEFGTAYTPDDYLNRIIRLDNDY